MTTIFSLKYSIKFYLKNKNSIKPTLIIAKVSAGGKVKQLSTRTKVLPSLWISDNQRSNTRTASIEDNQRAKIINDKLDIAYNKLLGFCEVYKSEPNFHTLVMNDFVYFVNPNKKKFKEIEIKNFSTMYDLFINYKQNVNPNVLLTMKRMKVMLFEFNPVTDFESINQIYVSDFHNYLMNVKGLSFNTAKNYNDILKTFLKFVQYQDSTIIINKNYELFKIKRTDKSYQIYLTESEWCSVLALDNLSPLYENTRHLLNIMFYTGLRVSDTITLGKQHVDFDNMIITKEVIKTRRKIKVSISNKIVESLKLAINGQFKGMNFHYMNDMFKHLGKLAGIDNEIEVIINKSKVVRLSKPKYSLLSCHTQRRSFITNLLKKGANPYDIMKISGHRTLESFNKYVALTDTDSFNAIKLLID